MSSSKHQTDSAFDGYGLVTSSEPAIDLVAELLIHQKTAFISWTDNLGTHFDLLFCLLPHEYGNVPGVFKAQGGLRPDDLFVSIMRRGAFGFAITDDPSHASYIGEKLNIGYGETAEALATLINGVRAVLFKDKHPNNGH